MGWTVNTDVFAFDFLIKGFWNCSAMFCT